MAQLEVVTANAPQKPVEQDWLDRQAQLLAAIDSDIDWYRRHAAAFRKWHRFLSIIVLICAVLAPVTVVSSTGTPVNGWISSTLLSAISVGITLIIALAEGLRRIFRFEERWTECSTAHGQLRSLREEYLDQQVGKSIGSEPWVENFLRARRETVAVVINETKGFFDVVRQRGGKSNTPGKV